MPRIESFAFSPAPRVVFGEGAFDGLGEQIGRYGTSVLLVTGGASADRSGIRRRLAEQCRSRALCTHEVRVQGEPGPELVDQAVAGYADRSIDVVCAVGGGSVVDTGKAISAMLPLDGARVADYLEGVGTKKHDGRKVPVIAVPTTAGTGSEATRNAVLTLRGKNGFKKSLRHDNFVPDIAIVDPALTFSCPPTVTAACGMDAFTQLLEAYVSTGASPVTDALAWEGLARAGPSLPRAHRDTDARVDMSFAALISGMVLANAGLGVVHGLASAVGALFDIPHGVVCGTLVGPATKAVTESLRRTDPDSPALVKYARTGALLGGGNPSEIDRSCDLLVGTLTTWRRQLSIPSLGAYGVTERDVDRIVEKTGNKNGPARLSPREIGGILRDNLVNP